MTEQDSGKTPEQILAEMTDGTTPIYPAHEPDPVDESGAYAEVLPIVPELEWSLEAPPEVKIGRSDDIRRLATALARAQGEMENAKKNRANAHFNTTYADLGAVVDATRDPLARHQIAKFQTINFNETECWLDSMLMHGPSGQYVTARYPLPKGAMSKPQDFVAAITYARRVSLSTMTGIATEDDGDDDGTVAAALGKDVNQDAPRPPSKQVQAAEQWWPYALRMIAKQPTRDAMTAWEEKETVSLTSLFKLLPDRHAEVMAALAKRYEELAAKEEPANG